MAKERISPEEVCALMDKLGLAEENGGYRCARCGVGLKEIGVHPDLTARLSCETCEEADIWARIRSLSAERSAAARMRVKMPEVITARTLSGMRLERTPQVVPGLVARGMTLLCGSPKRGKSASALDWCLAVSTVNGKAAGTLRTEFGDVLYISLEDSWERLQYRLDTALQGEPQPDRLHLALEWLHFDQGGEEQLDAWMEAYPDTRLICIDTFEIMRQTKKVPGLNAYQQDYHDLRAFKKFADRHKIAVVCVHHTNKTKMTDGDDIFR